MDNRCAVLATGDRICRWRTCGTRSGAALENGTTNNMRNTAGMARLKMLIDILVPLGRHFDDDILKNARESGLGQQMN